MSLYDRVMKQEAQEDNDALFEVTLGSASKRAAASFKEAEKALRKEWARDGSSPDAKKADVQDLIVRLKGWYYRLN